MVAKSPRILRPHTIVVGNVLPEIEWKEVMELTRVKYVNISDKVRNKNFVNTGSTVSDSVIITIDLNDYESNKSYVVPEKYEDYEKQFTIRAGDKVIIDSTEYEVTGTKLLKALKNGPEFLEVTVQ